MHHVRIHSAFLRRLCTVDENDYDLIVTVDTSSPDHLQQEIDLPVGKTVVIDHHQPTGKWEGYDCYIDSTKVACAQIILQIVRSP